MATSKKFSELPAASSVGNDDLFAIAHEDALAETGYVSQKLTAAQAGQKVNGDTEYPTSLPSFPENGQNPFAALEKLNADIEALYPVNTASGSIANFTTSLVKPLTALTSTIVAQQAGGTPTPSSPLPISGTDEVVITHCGANLLNPDLRVNGYYISVTGVITPESNSCYIYIKVNVGETYTFSGRAYGTGNKRVHAYDENKNWIEQLGYQSVSGTSDYAVTVTIPNGCKYVGLSYAKADANMSFVKGSTATAYKPYNADTFTIALGDTYYGGVLDAKNGKARITHTIKDLGDFEWVKDNTTYGFTFFYSSTQDVISNDIVCDSYKTAESHATFMSDDYVIRFADVASIRLRVKDSSKNALTGAEFKSAVTGVKMVCTLATPVEIDITANNFVTFASENNIFSDCGEVTVGFKQGIQEYIDAQIAATQALIL